LNAAALHHIQGANTGHHKPLNVLEGIRIALARFLRPVWNVSLFEASSATQPIAKDWQRLASEVHLIFTFVTQKEQDLRKMMRPGRSMDGRNVEDDQTRKERFERMCEFVKVCKEVCSLMAIVTENGLGTVVHTQMSGANYTFHDAVVKLYPGHDQNQSKDFRDKLKNVIDALIEQGTEEDNAFMTRGFGGGFGGTQGVGARVGVDRDMNPASRHRLINEIEDHCLYNRVSRELSTEDVRHMCDGFIALQEHLSALQVLIKRCSEKDRLEEGDATQLRELIERISQLPDRSVFARALKMCLEHRGLYVSQVEGKSIIDKLDERPAVDYVLQAVIRSGDYLLHWPILRKQECLRLQTHHAHQRLVEFLKSRREWDKLVEFYNEIEQFSRAQETCDQQAHQPYHQGDGRPTLDDRVHWFRQAATAASLGGRANKQKDYDFKADLCDVQKRLRASAMKNNQPHEDDLERKIMSPQELFNTAINMKCWEMALEVMDVLHDAGIVQPDGPQVVDRLWNLLLNNAWDAGGSDHRSKWAKLEITLVDVGRRYASSVCVCACVLTLDVGGFGLSSAAPLHSSSALTSSICTHIAPSPPACLHVHACEQPQIFRAHFKASILPTQVVISRAFFSFSLSNHFINKLKIFFFFRRSKRQRNSKLPSSPPPHTHPSLPPRHHSPSFPVWREQSVWRVMNKVRESVFESSPIVNSFLPLSVDRYVDKPDLLPLKVVVNFLEDCAEKSGVSLLNLHLI